MTKCFLLLALILSTTFNSPVLTENSQTHTHDENCYVKHYHNEGCYERIHNHTEECFHNEHDSKCGYTHVKTYYGDSGICKDCGGIRVGIEISQCLICGNTGAKFMCGHEGGKEMKQCWSKCGMQGQIICGKNMLGKLLCTIPDETLICNESTEE